MTQQRVKVKAKSRKFRGKDQVARGNNAFAFGANNGFGNVTSGGFTNPMTGAGTSLDKSQSGFFSPTWITNRTELETLYTESFACQHFIDFPVDDMFIRYRQFDETDEKVVEDLEAQEKQFMVQQRLARAMKAGALYGTGLMCVITKEALLTDPMDIRRIRAGDLRNFIVTDRYSATVIKRDTDFMSPTYNEPLEYRIDLKRGHTFHIHASRVIRFDGIRPLASDGWYNYFDDWGQSEVIPIITSILQDQSLSQGISHLTQEASIPVQKIHDFQDALEAGPDSMSLAQRGEIINTSRSIFRTIYMDANDEFQRQEVSFSGLPDLMDRFARRMAGAAGIPATRFWGQSPVGMNATGDGDMANYAAMITAKQNDMLRDPLAKLDQILLRNAGHMQEMEVKYKFPSLIDQSEQEQAEAADKKMDIAVKGIVNNIMDEDECRAMLDGDEIIGTLKDTPDFDEEEEEDAERSFPGAPEA